jgi:hypothetical protein
MSFDIGRTPTLHAVASGDERLLVQDLQKRVEESIRQAEARADVLQASESHRAAEERRIRLQKAERVLSRFAKDSRERLVAASQAAIAAIVESSAQSGHPDFSALDDLDGMEAQHRHANRAIQQIVEHTLPLAQIASLREESHALMTTAQAVEQIAQERAEKLLEHLRAAVSEEVVLPVDLSQGVAGALIAHAGGLKRRALQASETADQLERAYCDRNEVGAGR